MIFTALVKNCLDELVFEILYIEYALCVILKYVQSDQIYHVCLIVLFLDELVKDLSLGIVSGEDDHMIGRLLNTSSVTKIKISLTRELRIKNK